MAMESGERYVFINKRSGTALDLDTSDNKSVQGWARHGGPNQQWEAIYDATRAGWQIKNVQQGTYLGYEGTEDGKRVICTPTIVIWGFAQQNSSGVYRIVTGPSAFAKSVDLADGSSANGTPVQMWSSSLTNGNQQWQAQQVRV